ncbi:MAG TPA: DUF2188 domain-containing protein [bacterium]|nr:DUF2188 domain-containing protein [bacterium]
MSETRISKEKKDSIIKHLGTLRSRDDKIHVISKEGRWAVKKEGRSRAYRVLDTKKEAIKTACSITKRKPKWEIVVHKKDGTVEARLPRYNNQ